MFGSTGLVQQFLLSYCVFILAVWNYAVACHWYSLWCNE